jgi:hypothetical protein
LLWAVHLCASAGGLLFWSTLPKHKQHFPDFWLGLGWLKHELRLYVFRRVFIWMSERNPGKDSLCHSQRRQTYPKQAKGLYTRFPGVNLTSFSFCVFKVVFVFFLIGIWVSVV